MNILASWSYVLAGDNFKTCHICKLYFTYFRSYAALYTIAEFIFETFDDTVDTELGFTAAGLWEYFYTSHTSAIRSIHVEQDHAVNNIRYVCVAMIVKAAILHLYTFLEDGWLVHWTILLIIPSMRSCKRWESPNLIRLNLLVIVLPCHMILTTWS